MIRLDLCRYRQADGHCRTTRNVKRWRDAGMALRWVAAGMIEANKGFRRLEGA
jgi:hypothetical protein